MAGMRVTVCAIFRVPHDGMAAFRQYEDAVLPLLQDHGGELERRLRSANESAEVHIISFPDQSAMDAYRADPRRARHADLFAASGASVEVLTVTDVA